MEIPLKIVQHRNKMRIIFLIFLKGFLTEAIDENVFLIKDFLLLQNKQVGTHLFACWRNCMDEIFVVLFLGTFSDFFS